MKWTEEEAAYLDRMARKLSDEFGLRVSRAEVLRGLVRIAMAQEAALDPGPLEVSPEPALGLGLHELSRTLRAVRDRWSES